MAGAGTSDRLWHKQAPRKVAGELSLQPTLSSIHQNFPARCARGHGKYTPDVFHWVEGLGIITSGERGEDHVDSEGGGDSGDGGGGVLMWQ